ncbi:MAG: ATP-dependent DNA helicase [Candidatus Nanopelagicales bacterium]
MRTSDPRTRTQAELPRDHLADLLGFPLSDEQWECVSAPLEPFVIVAGAGTGKTTVMAARVVWLVASGLVAEHEVLGLTFTNKATAELARRITDLLARWRETSPVDSGTTVGEPTIATYHSFARRLLDEQGLRVGIEPGARMLPGALVAQLAYRVVCSAAGLKWARTEPSRLAASVLALDANLAEQTITTEELRAHARDVVAEVDALAKPTRPVRTIRDAALRRAELADLVDRLRASRAEVGGLDFTDHMRMCVELVRSSDELVRRMRDTYRVILLDEYQDTSIAQRLILSTLFRGCAVTAVGDPMQAIYGWRSASVANIEAFGAHFGHGGAAPVRVLSLNRRSGEPILAAANRIAAGLRELHPQIAVLRAPAPRAAEVRAALLPTVVDEREWVADQVAATIAEGTPPEHIGVLGRANDDLVPLRAALAARGVPAVISGSAALTASPFAVEVLATLRVLHDPADGTAAAALLTGPRWRIGPQDMERLGSRARHLVTRKSTEPDPGPGEPGVTGATGATGVTGVTGVTVSDRLQAAVASLDPVERPSLVEAAADPGPFVSAEARDRLALFTGELRRLQAHTGDPLPDLTALVVEVTGAKVEAALSGVDGFEGAGGDGPGPGGDVGLAGLMQVVDEFADAEGRTGLGSFLAYLDAAQQFGAGEQVELPAVPGAVQLMTVHKAKGLEWPVVVLPHVCHGTFPSRRPSERWTTIPHVVPTELRDDRHVLPELHGLGSAQIEEFAEACRRHDRTGEDRLAYVAVTRARDRLIASGHWWGPSQQKARGPSDYLSALREQSTGSSCDPWADEPPEGDAGPASNPLLDEVLEVPWPVREEPGAAGRLRAADAVRAVLSAGRSSRPPWEMSGGLAAPSSVVSGPTGSGASRMGAVERQVAQWDSAILAMLARSDGAEGAARTVVLPGALTASAAMELAADPDGFALRLLRPMPRRRSRHAELGTAFHAWVEARLGVQPLITDEDLPGAADAGIESPAELEALKEAFERLPYALRVPAGLEVPFSLVVAGRVLRGRIDAVFPAAAGAPAGQLWEVVDWKTSAHDRADPLQLAIYRLAWAELRGVPLDAVGAAFVFVRSGAVERLSDLLDGEGVAAVLSGS